MAMDWASASFTRSGSTTTLPRPLFWRYCEIIEAAVCGSSVAPPLAMDRYMAGCSGCWLSDMQPAVHIRGAGKVHHHVGMFPHRLPHLAIVGDARVRVHQLEARVPPGQHAKVAVLRVSA